MKRGLGKSDRIRRRRDLDRVFRAGRRVSDAVLLLHVLPNGLARSRMAVAVSSRHGKAVRRNRIKRICREAFRACRTELPPGCDYVLRPRAGVEPTLTQTCRSLKTLAGRLARGGAA